MSRNRFLKAIVVVILVVFAFIMGSYVYVIPPAKIEVSMISEHDESRLPEGTTMILCPNKAGEMGLCNTDERDLHAKYRLVVQPPPPSEVSLRVECKVLRVEPLPAFDNSIFPVGRSFAWEKLKTDVMDATSNFTCSFTRTGEGTFELDLAFIADPDDEQLILRYLLVVTIGYDESLLPFGLFTRNVNGTDLGDLCLLGYHIGKHPGTPKSEKPLGELVSCDEAVLAQRDLLNIPPPPRLRSRVDSGLLRVLPTIDGFMGPREWSDAGKLPLDGRGVDVGLYAKNDNDFLYVAADVTPSQQAAASSRFEVRLFFDVDHDSAWVEGRDVVYVYSSNPSYSGFIRYSEECQLNFLSLGGDYLGGYSELAPCLTPLNEPGAMHGRYYEGLAGHWVVEMMIPLRGQGGIMTEPGQVVGTEIGIYGGADSYKDPGFYGRSPAHLIDLALASMVGTGDGVSRIAQSSSLTERRTETGAGHFD